MGRFRSSGAVGVSGAEDPGSAPLQRAVKAKLRVLLRLGLQGEEGLRSSLGKNKVDGRQRVANGLAG